MIKPRVEETRTGIQEVPTVDEFVVLQRTMRDRGQMVTGDVISSGIDAGAVLEIGPGPGFLGLEWLSRTEDTYLTGLEISGEMINRAEGHAGEYGLSERASYIRGSALDMPLKESSFQAVISNGSLHEWEDPRAVFHEIYRVLVPGGCFFISDLRRDLNPLIRWIMKSSVKGPLMKRGFQASFMASYLTEEVEDILREIPFSESRVEKKSFGLQITGRKKLTDAGPCASPCR